MEEQAESQTSNDDLCVGGESEDVFQTSTPQVELHGKDGKEQGITSQKTEQIDAPATYHEDLMDGTSVNLTEKQTQLMDLMCLMRQQVDGLISTLQDYVDDVTRLEDENPNCEICSVTKDNIKSIFAKLQLFSNKWESVGQEILQELKETSFDVHKQKGEMLRMKAALHSVQAKLARHQ